MHRAFHFTSEIAAGGLEGHRSQNGTGEHEEREEQVFCFACHVAFFFIIQESGGNRSFLERDGLDYSVVFCAFDGGEGDAERLESLNSGNGHFGAILNRAHEGAHLIEIRIVCWCVGRFHRNRLTGYGGSDDLSFAAVVFDHALAAAHFERNSSTAGISPSGFDMGDCAALERERGERVIGPTVLIDSERFRVDMGDFAESPSEPVEIVDSEIEEDSAALVGISEPVSSGRESAAASSGGGGGSDFASDHSGAGNFEFGEVANHLADHKRHVGFVGSFDESSGFLVVKSERLFHEQRFASFNRFHAERKVKVSGKTDVDGVARFDERFGGGGSRGPIVLGECSAFVGVDIEDLQFDARDVVVMAGMHSAHSARTQNPDSHEESMANFRGFG